MAQFKIKKLGNHWYFAINHDYDADISIDPKLEKVLDLYNRTFNYDEFTIELQELPFIIDDEPIIYFDESDLTRYYITNDSFDLRFYVREHEFFVSDYIFNCLESEFNLNFHENIYRIYIN